MAARHARVAIRHASGTRYARCGVRATTRLWRDCACRARDAVLGAIVAMVGAVRARRALNREWDGANHRDLAQKPCDGIQRPAIGTEGTRRARPAGRCAVHRAVRPRGARGTCHRRSARTRRGATLSDRTLSADAVPRPICAEGTGRTLVDTGRTAASGRAVAVEEWTGGHWRRRRGVPARYAAVTGAGAGARVHVAQGREPCGRYEGQMGRVAPRDRLCPDLEITAHEEHRLVVHAHQAVIPNG